MLSTKQNHNRNKKPNKNCDTLKLSVTNELREKSEMILEVLMKIAYRVLYDLLSTDIASKTKYFGFHYEMKVSWFLN